MGCSHSRVAIDERKTYFTVDIGKQKIKAPAKCLECGEDMIATWNSPATKNPMYEKNDDGIFILGGTK